MWREGDGILLIDQIDHQLDQQQAAQILTRLHRAFPRLQIIATGNRSELLEQAERFQCLKLGTSTAAVPSHGKVYNRSLQKFMLMC